MKRDCISLNNIEGDRNISKWEQNRVFIIKIKIYHSKYI